MTTPLIDCRSPLTPPSVKFEAKRFVVDAMDAKNDVVVAFVPVAFTNVKFWSVEEPVTNMFTNDASPDVVNALNVAVPETARFVVVAFVVVVLPKMLPAVQVFAA